MNSSLISRRAFVLALGCAAAGCRDRARQAATAAPAAAHLVQRTELTMGSPLTLSVWTADDQVAQAALAAGFAEFNRLDALLSVWKDNSDVLRVNAAAGEHTVHVSPETIEVLALAREASALTDGRFDITFGALSDLWRFDQDQDNVIPSPAVVRQRLPLVDYKALEVDTAAGTAFLKRKGMRANLGGIGKGYAVDRVAAIFRGRGLADFMIQAGGDLYVGGHRDGRPWRLGIADPRNADGPPFATIELSDSTLSTSGDYERFFMSDGVRYHHILDLTTGQPARGCRSVTLVSKRAVFADALAKGVFILGPVEGMALIERLPDVEGVIVSSRNDVLVSSGLTGKVTIAHPPTDAP